MPKPTPDMIVVIGDTHCGCQMALVPPAGCILDGGGTYTPSAFQTKLWAMWTQFWSWVAKETKGHGWDLVHMGDAIDGVHHNSTSQITHNLEDQREIAISVLQPRIDACHASGGRFYFIRGTPVHSGESGCDEEDIAKRLGAVPNAEGNHARFDLWKMFGPYVINFMHHVGTTGSNAYEATALNKEFMEMCVEAARWGYRPPDMVCRAHRHRCMKIDIPRENGDGIVITGPAWEGKTPFAYRVAGARVSTPQFGGYIIKRTPSTLYVVKKLWSIEPSRMEE